ncbi:MAG: nuclear transport factor 2 family protein [Dehalobacter sp. 4CP]|uniref:nuclear transport factor 2 family protein n=1 Tax=Dehalobacter sp. CP TaxID=2594474 RepID=UPI0013C94DB3|nr:nuclear transport factor 2 family protein [Dehalobacter sp.]NBJ14367.1 nuclear transport factor 2 family protein [Dehalobacter sp. 4CP]
MFERSMGNNTAEEIIDKFNIKELVEFERYCRDQKLWDEMEKCFHPDSSVNISWFSGTGHEFIEASKKMQSNAKHKINDTLIWLNKYRAVVEMMATIHIFGELDGFPVDLMSYSRLHFRVEKREGIWRISSFDCICEKDLLVPVYPNNQIVIQEEQLRKYRPSYASLSYMLAKEGYDIDINLAGEDKPETIKKLYETSTKWLEI